MKPTDKVLEAVASWIEGGLLADPHSKVFDVRSETLAKIAALLRACKGRDAIAPQAVRIKRLVWDGDDDYIHAESPSGSYGINLWKSAATGVVSRIEMDGENYPSIEAAKAAAQADYEARILSAIEEPGHE